MRKFKILNDAAAIKEIAHMETDLERISDESKGARMFSTRLVSHQSFKYSSLYLEPTSKTTDVLKGKRS